MAFEQIRITNLRNLADGEIEPHHGINLIKGENGSGKTSLLEAVYILARGRSFRDRQLINAVKRNEDAFTLFARKRLHDRHSTIGVNYSRVGGKIRIDGRKVSKLSLLALETPLHILTPGSHEIIDKGSSTRRRFLEWGVFHVEPLYQYFSSRYQRALDQRNAALRENPDTAKLWNRELAESGTRLTNLRACYFAYLRDEFFRQLELLSPAVELDLSLYQGWSKEKSLAQVLEESFTGDVKRGFTRVGPHRADLVFKVEKKAFEKWSSRGQLKISIIALFIAQAQVIKSLTRKDPVLLIDDLTAELDRNNVQRVFDRLYSEGHQVFITSTDENLTIETGSGKMFHVEQGALSEVGV